MGCAKNVVLRRLPEICEIWQAKFTMDQVVGKLLTGTHLLYCIKLINILFFEDSDCMSMSHPNFTAISKYGFKHV